MLDIDPQKGGEAQIPKGGRNNDFIRLLELPGQGEHRPAEVPGLRQGVPLPQGGRKEGLDVQSLQDNGLNLRLGVSPLKGGEEGLRQHPCAGTRSPLADTAIDK